MTKAANDIVLDFVRAFDDLEIPYMLLGSFSSNLYGRPRSTKDADFVIQGVGASIGALRLRLGAEYQFDPQATFETVTETTRFVVQHEATPFAIEIFLLTDEPHDRSRCTRRKPESFHGHSVWLPTAEDVVVTKLRWATQGQRMKDIDDVRDILAVQRESLDLTYVRRWCDEHNTRELLERLLRESLP